MKARASSDPPHQENATFDSCQKFSVTLPNRIAPHLRKAEPFPSISAAQLLSLEVSHSGWVRKEGFGIRTWRSRFMVLHHGCIYYFKDTDSHTPKGKFALNGYRCFEAPDREGADRFPYVFKLVPDDDELRTYYVSSPSKIEMRGWITSIEKDIQRYCPSDYDYVDPLGDSIKVSCPTVQEDLPDVKGRSKIAGNPDSSSKTFPKNIGVMKPKLLDPPSNFPTSPSNNGSDEVDQVYDTIPDGEENYTQVISHDETDGQQRSFGPPMVNNNDRPHTLGPKLPPRPDIYDSESDGSDSEEEQHYVNPHARHKSLPLLPLRENKANDSSATMHAEKSRPIPTPPTDDGVDGANDDIVVTYCAVIGNDEFDDIRQAKEDKSHPIPPPRPSPRPPPRHSRTNEERKPFDYLPADCFKPDMLKNQAKVFLELGRTLGEYIINASQTSDTKMSLSVWLSKGVKHYLIFKRQDKYTLDPSLHHDEHFKELRDLVKYYFEHPLPKTGQCLTKPFATR